MDFRLEVIGIPVSDVDASIAFYRDQVGFHLDHDVSMVPGMRVVQLTPAGSPTSVVFGEGMPLGEPGTTKGMRESAFGDRPSVVAVANPSGLEVRLLHRPRRQRLVPAEIRRG